MKSARELQIEREGELLTTMPQRHAMIAEAHERWPPENDCEVTEIAEAYTSGGTLDEPYLGAMWLLVQYNGGRAPNEKWLSLHDTLEALGQYVRADEEWHPEAIVNLLTGEVHEVEVHVKLGARTDQL